MLMAASQGSSLVSIERGGRCGGDASGARQSLPGDYLERDEIDTRCGNVTWVIVALARVRDGWKMLAVVGGVDMGSQIGHRWLATTRKHPEAATVVEND